MKMFLPELIPTVSRRQARNSAIFELKRKVLPSLKFRIAYAARQRNAVIGAHRLTVRPYSNTANQYLH